MSKNNSLAELLQESSRLFSLAGKLARKFDDVGRSRGVFFDPSIWKALEFTFDELRQGLISLRDPMENPPEHFLPIADALRDAARIVKRIKEQVKAQDNSGPWEGEAMGRALGVESLGRPQFTAFIEFAAPLLAASTTGLKAVADVAHSLRLDDPLAFVDELPKEKKPKPMLSLLDRYPATDIGHVKFLEWVHIEAKDQARFLKDGRYSHESIEKQLKQGVKWGEALQRIGLIRCRRPEVAERVARIYRRELSIGTVEELVEALGPALRALRRVVETPDDDDSTTVQPPVDRISALESVKRELQLWDRSNSPSVTGYLVEQIQTDHPLHMAVGTSAFLQRSVAAARDWTLA